MTKLRNFLLMFIILHTASSIALAQANVVWSCNAMAAQPADTDLLDSSAGKVRFKKGKSGNIRLICPISDDLGRVSLRSLRLTYRDGDGRQGPSVVTAELRRVRRSDGHVATLPRGKVSSNSANAPNSGLSGWATHQTGSPGNVLSHVLDLESYYYYVQINLKRTGAVPVSVIGVHLIN